ncbi:MAG: mechanosensitive ion channel family protein [Pseudomonadota bacterium]
MSSLLLRAALFFVLVLAVLNVDQIGSFFFAESGSAQTLVFAQVLQSVTWFAGAFLAISLIELFFWRGVAARLARHPVPALLKNTVALIVLVIAAACIMSFVFNRDVTAIWATSGVVGLVLGFALRSMIQDVFTGIALNLDGSIQEGDWISLHHRDFIDEQYGKVLDIGWRVSRVQLEDNNVVVVPNGLLGTMAVTNFAHADHVSRLQVEIVMDFDVPLDRARRILLAGATAAASEDGILQEPAPVVLIGAPKAYGVSYLVRFWGKLDERSPSSLKDAALDHLLKHLYAVGLAPALPKEDVYFERKPKRLLDHKNKTDRVSMLSRSQLFNDALHSDELAELAGKLSVCEYAIDQVVIQQGDEGQSLFLVAEGFLDVHITGDKGTTTKVGHISAGEIFGEMSMLTGEPRSATVTASTQVVTYEVKRDDLQLVLDNRPDIAEAVSQIVARRQAANADRSNVNKPVDIQSQEVALTKRILEGMTKVFSLKNKANAGSTQSAHG